MSLAQLPPVPASPDQPPAVLIPGERSCWMESDDGVRIEGLMRTAPTTGRIVVLCHPHPLYGGTKDNALIVAIAKALCEQPVETVGTLRFDFRGVHGSQGRFEGGMGEVRDVCAAVAAAHVQSPKAKVTLAGYSFGAAIALQAMAPESRAEWVDRLALIAPGFQVLRIDPPAPKRRIMTRVLVGDQDEFVDVAEARDLAQRLGATLDVLPGADHSFLRQRRRVATLLQPFLLGMPEADSSRTGTGP